MIPLRPYQQDSVDRLRTAYAAGARAPLFVLPTGGGKTQVFSHIVEAVAARGRRACILVHRRELIRQASAKLASAGVAHGIIAPGHTPSRDAVQVASVQTLGRRLQAGRARKNFDLVVIDEAHHAAAGQWAEIVAAMPGARLLGVTATPQRLDGKGLGIASGGPFDALVEGPSIADLTAAGFLVPAEVFAPSVPLDLDGISTRAGDWAADQLAARLDRPAITGSAVEHYARLAPGLPAVAFCASVAHARHVAEQFSGGGWRAVAVGGGSDPKARDAAIAGLASGAVQVLASCDLISEGLDVPSVAAVILLRPTQSLGLYMQQVGRGLRPAPGKDRLIVLDHAGNIFRHGLPDAERAWSLDTVPRNRRAAPALPALRQCEACFAIHRPAPACPACGHRAAAADAQPEQLAGELARVDGAQAEALRQGSLWELLRAARSRAEVDAIRIARGYKPGWTWHVMRERRCREVAA